MLVDALTYPTRGPPTLVAAGTVIAAAIGYRYTAAVAPSVLAVVPAALSTIAAIALIGYLSRVLVDDGRTPPPVDAVASVGSGFRSIGVTAVFLAVPAVLMLTTIASFTEAGSGADDGLPAVFLVSSTATLFLFLASAYVLPAALAATTEVGSIRAAFDRERLQPALGDLTYVTAWTTAFPLFVIALIPVAITLDSADVSGVISSVFGAYLVLASGRLISTGYRRST